MSTMPDVEKPMSADTRQLRSRTLQKVRWSSVEDSLIHLVEEIDAIEPESLCFVVPL